MEIENDSLTKFFKNAPKEQRKYSNIATEDFDNEHIFYLVSEYSRDDIKHLKEVEKLNKVNIIRFVNSHHGVPFLKPALPVVLNMDKNQLCKLKKHRHYPLLFEISYAGFFPTIKYLLQAVRKTILR